ncbi:hypothetical protein [Stenotrophomonas sp. YAU14A_MKIMI4_1]|uniref:hypothetical protein n=1 Tax=Stenotrophomonas sp. YAU14A_MKIMI4_1 TaxID=2072408 RepID=UPI000D53EA80|nr:hypothetical protein [Stenotrophomonas sp. YAU14A_MKIMI4_1]AWH29535.1 hypothetical protein C1931_11785 [Stenotrophomonas sp. YAU14A_MKIMI4_1]
MTVATDVNAASPLITMEKNMETAPRALKKKSLSSRIRTSLMGASLTAMLAAPVQAYTLPVVEIGMQLFNGTMTEVNTLTSQAEAFIEYGEQYKRFYDTTQNWLQKLAQFQQIIAAPNMPSGITLTPVPDDWNVSERCGLGVIGGIGDLLSAMKLNPKGDIAQQQKEICAAIQLIQNKKYNETISVVQDTLPEIRGVLDKIKSIRELTSKEGGMTETMTNAQLSDSYMQADFTAWETRIKMYDRQISALERQQEFLTERALKGTRSPLGTVVKTAALKAALSL